MSEFYDPYEKKRRLARQRRQGRLAHVVTPGLPIDGDAKEVRRPVQRAGDGFDAVLASLDYDLYKAENNFIDVLREQWEGLFPGFPARPGRWANNRLVLYVKSAPQLFALRPKLPAVTRQLRALPNAPKTPFAVILQIHA